MLKGKSTQANDFNLILYAAKQHVYVKKYSSFFFFSWGTHSTMLPIDMPVHIIPLMALLSTDLLIFFNDYELPGGGAFERGRVNLLRCVSVTI